MGRIQPYLHAEEADLQASENRASGSQSFQPEECLDPPGNQNEL